MVIMPLMPDLLPDLSSHEESSMPWSRSRSFRARVISAQLFQLHQGSLWVCVVAGFIMALAGVWLSLRHEVELRPVEGRQRVKVTERARVFGVRWKTVAYDEVTVVRRLDRTKGGSLLELRGPGWSRYLWGPWLSNAELEVVEEAVAAFLAGGGKAQVLNFPAPWWVSLALMLPAVVMLVVMRPARARVDGVRREIEVMDWAGLWRQTFPAARLVRVSVEDGDPTGWRARAYLPERWLIVAHLQPGGQRLLASVADRETAAQWASRVSLMFDQGRLVGVSAGEYRVWDRESAL
jgi:hypothetical protein